MQKIELQAWIRQSVGKLLNSLRREGFLPAIVYGHNFKAIPIQVKYVDFEKVYKAAGESTLINLKIDGQAELVVIKDIQRDPVTDKVIHVDFYKVHLREKLRTKVPLIFTGESEAVKGGGILVKTLNEIEVEALPQNLPHELFVDISVLKNIGDHILVKDIPLPEGVKIMANPEEFVVLVQEPRQEEIEAAPAPMVEGVEIIKKEGKAEEAPSEEIKNENK